MSTVTGPQVYLLTLVFFAPLAFGYVRHVSHLGLLQQNSVMIYFNGGRWYGSTSALLVVTINYHHLSSKY
jgi:hypothetical protein